MPQKISLKILKKYCNEYDRFEDRGIYYYWAVDLYVKGYKLQAMILLLATWNFAYFRYVVTNKDFLPSFKKALSKCELLSKKIANEKIQQAKFDLIGDNIKKIYHTLSGVEGIKYVGATKIMHLINRELFVMWDNAIKEFYGFRTSTAEDYLDFLKKMQKKFGHIKWDDRRKTLAKAIDEFNYIMMHLPSPKARKQFIYPAFLHS